MDSFYNQKDILNLNFYHVGENVKISKNARFYGAENMSIGNNVRIDDFCVLSGKITIGNNIHISSGCYIFAGLIGVELDDFATLSSRCAIYAISDDYSGGALTGPTVPLEYRNVIQKKVVLKKHSIVGTGSVILPGSVLEEGCAVGAMSLVNKPLPTWKVCVGIPAKPIRDRRKKMLELEISYKSKYLDV